MSECVYNYDDDVITKYTLVEPMPSYKVRRKYNSVGEEEGSSYSSVNSGDAEDQQGFLSEQNGDSLGHNPILAPLKSGSISSQNVASSIESSDDDDDDDLEVDGELPSVGDSNRVSVSKMLIDNQIQMMRPLKYISTFSERNAPSTESSDDDDDLQVDGGDCIGIKKIPSSFGSVESSSMFCSKTKVGFESSTTTANNPKEMSANKHCNDDDALKSSATISNVSKFSSPHKSDKQDLLKLFAMANVHKQRMEESSASSMSANKKRSSALSKPSLSDEISRSIPLIQNETNLKSNYDKHLSSSKENSRKLDSFQQKGSSSSNSSSSSSSSSNSSNNNNDDLSPLTNKCKDCCANQVNSKKGSNRMSLADLTKERFGSSVKEPLPKVGSFFSPSTSSSCPNNQNTPPPSAQPSSLRADSSSSQPLIDLTNQRSPGQSSNSSNDKRFGFQSLNSENKSFKTKDKDKRSVTSLADLMKQRSTSDISSSPFQSCSDLSLTEIFKKGGETCSQGTPEKSIDKDPPTCIKESGSSLCKIASDSKKNNSFPSELSMNVDDKNGLAISDSGSKKECQPMSLGELFSRVNAGTVDVNSDATSNLEDLWQGPSSKPTIEPSQQEESTDVDKSLENASEKKFLLTSFLGVSSEYQKVKTIYEAPASMFGTVISYHPQTLKYTEKIPSLRRKNRYQKFSYKSQMLGTDLNRATKLAQIVPFDFSTASPDDIVKKHQSEAFCHKNIEPQRV